MKTDVFELERFQSLYENEVAYNLTESGIHPYSLRELLGPSQLEELMDLRLTYGQTNGLPELRERIAGLYNGLTRDHVLVTNGSSEANFIACMTCLEPGDEVVMMIPNYMQISGITQMLGVTVRHFHLWEESGWRPDLQQLRQLTNEKTAMIILCNPNNPTGAVLSMEEMQEIVSIADSCGAWIYCDEVYRGAELDGVDSPSFIGLYDKVMVTGGLSKAYALPGLRLGWLAGPVKTMEEAWATSDYTSITASIFSNQVAIWALESEKRAEIQARNRNLLRKNLEVFSAWSATQGKRFRFIPPKAGGFAFSRYDMDIDANELVERMRLERDVFLVSGSWFGLNHFLRIGLGSETDYFEQALARVGSALDEWFGEARV